MYSILIVDDDATIRALLKTYLEQAGYDCSEAINVPSARLILASNPVDLVLSDINMPGESGIDLARFIKKEYPETAIVMVSVIDNPTEAKEALQLGVYGYIVKPFTRNLVLIGVDNALRRRRLEIQQNAYKMELEATVRQQTVKLHSQVAFLQTLIDAMPSPLFYRNKNGILSGCNKAFEQFTGITREKLIGRDVSEILPGKLGDSSRQMDHLHLSEKQKEYAVPAINAEGKERDLLIRKAVYMDEKGLPGGLVGVMLDITEQKKIELELRTSEEKYRQIVDNIGIGVALISPEMKVLQMNAQLHKWFPDIKPEEGLPCYQLFHVPPRESACENCPTLKTFNEGGIFDTTVHLQGASGGRDFRTLSSPIHDENSKVIASIVLIEDVTDKLALEQELRQAQKLEAIGQLAAGIAHEINTPIQYIGDNTEFIQDAFDDIASALEAYDELHSIAKDLAISATTLTSIGKRVHEADLPYLIEEVPRAIEQSLEGVSRVSKIVSAMREFSHPGTDQKTPLDINRALENTITVARNEWKYVADLEMDFDPDLPEVQCLPGEINQVFLNILINAAHAVADHTDGGREGLGKISVSTCKKDTTAIIRISDSGNGIPEAIQHRIFDPFFTTKSVGKGTGQGLAIAHNVITEKHGGSLSFETQHTKGTTFIIELPLTTGGEVQ